MTNLSTPQSAVRAKTSTVGAVLGSSGNLRILTLITVIIVLSLVFHVASEGLFFTPRNLTLLFRQAALVSILAAGVSTLMVMGEIDLSIGSAVYLCSAVAATAQVTYGMGTFEAVLVTLAVGLLLGMWQGAWTVLIAVPSFVVTLAGLLAFRGLGFYATDAATIGPVTDSFVALSEAFLSPAATSILISCFLALVVLTLGVRLAKGKIAPTAVAVNVVVAVALSGLLAWVFLGVRGIPTALLWVVGIGLVLTLVMARTTFGRNSYLIGSNREAARLSGIAIGRQVFVGFAVMGLLYGVGGLLLTARLASSTANSGTYLELDAIAAAVIGGTSLRGGVGKISGAILGALLLTAIDNGMSILNVSSFIQYVVKGMVLLLALGLDSLLLSRRSGRRSNRH